MISTCRLPMVTCKTGPRMDLLHAHIFFKIPHICLSHSYLMILDISVYCLLLIVSIVTVTFYIMYVRAFLLSSSCNLICRVVCSLSRFLIFTSTSVFSYFFLSMRFSSVLFVLGGKYMPVRTSCWVFCGSFHTKCPSQEMQRG